MPKQIAGSVYWIENGKQTTRVVDVKEAFSDPDQAKAQIVYAESSGDRRQLRLSRLAFRQFQGKRYRVEGKVAPRREPATKQKPAGKGFAKKVARKKASRKARA